MVLRALFFTCMFASLHEIWQLDLTLLFVGVLFPRSWRSVKYDFSLLLFILLLVYLLEDYSEWRLWHPIVLPTEMNTIIKLISEALKGRIQSISNGEFGGFLKAVLLADKSNLSAETVFLFRELGISHVLAVSGFHIGFWVVVLRPWFIWLRTPEGKLLAHFLQFLLLFIYAQMVGASSSVLRAVWMYGVARFALLHNRRVAPLHFPMLVAVGHYFINPEAPKSLSFQLSYTAVFAILLALQKHKGKTLILHYEYKHSRKQGTWFFVPLQISLAAWSATLPLVQNAFGGASPYFLAGNLVVVPLITLMIWASVPLLLLIDLLPPELLGFMDALWLSMINAAESLLFALQKLC